MLSSFLNKNDKRVNGVSELVAMADVASRSVLLACTSALGASSLKLLDEPRHDFLVLNNLTLSMALGTVVDVVWIVSATASAVRADGLLVVCQFKVFASVQLFKSSSDLQSETGSRLLLLFLLAKHVSKGMAATTTLLLLLLVLSNALLSTPVIPTAFIRVRQHLICRCYILELLPSGFISLVFIGMVLHS